MELKVDALVVRTADYGESDRMLTLFSLQNGKISAAAKGVRKAGAKLRFAAQPFCFAEYVLAQKGERYTMISASGTDGFYELRQDIGKFYAAASLAGLCDAVLPEGIVNEELFLRAVNSLKEMCEGDAALALISFFIKLLELSGVAGGCFYCPDCARGAGVSESTLQVLKMCAGQEYDASLITADGKKRALKLLYAYFRQKTDSEVKAIEEYLRMPD